VALSVDRRGDDLRDVGSLDVDDDCTARRSGRGRDSGGGSGQGRGNDVLLVPAVRVPVVGGRRRGGGGGRGGA